MAQAFAKEKLKARSNQRPHVYNQAIENSLSYHPLGYVVNSHHINQGYRFREEVKNYEPLIDGLEHAFSNSSFCCGGSFRTCDMDTFVLKIKPKDSAEDKESWREFSLGNVPADELLKYCNPAPFGDLKEMILKFVLPLKSKQQDLRFSEDRIQNITERLRMSLAGMHRSINPLQKN